MSDVFVHDNEKVSKGQQLFRIDQRRFRYAIDQAKADVASQQATLDQAKRDLVRSKSLTDVAITRQQVERAQQATDEAQAKLDAANASLEVARLNLERSTILAPVNGIVTNFDLLPGRYVNVGTAVFALIDSDTFRVEGYFEETKLRRIRIGEDATVKLIGDPRVLSGHVESIAYGIEDQNRSYEQRAAGLRQSDLQLGSLGTAHPSADQARRCAAGPSSCSWPHGHRVGWEDQMVVNARKAAAAGRASPTTAQPRQFAALAPYSGKSHF